LTELLYCLLDMGTGGLLDVYDAVLYSTVL